MASEMDAQKYLESQYSSQDKLAVRIRTHQLYSEGDIDFAPWVLDTISWRGDELVLDVGCGAGVYTNVADARSHLYIAGDLSLGMLRELSNNTVPRVNLDAQMLPVRDNSVDVILANHMLYHVPDIDRALAQYSRVLKPGGRLLAATNSNETMRELEELHQHVMMNLDGRVTQRWRPHLSFSLEDGDTWLRRHFVHVRQRLLSSAFVFPSAQPVIDYIASSLQPHDQRLPAGVPWAHVATALEQAIEERLAQDGEFRVSKLTGVYVAWND